MATKSGFAAEFAKQRAKLGAGKTFTYNGKSYSTNRADDKPAAKTAPASSPRPQPRPAAPAASSVKAETPRPNRAAGIATPAAPPRAPAPSSSASSSSAPASSPRPKPRPAAPSTPAPSAPASSPRPQPRPTEIIGASGGQRKPNADGKYSPSREMQFRSAAAKPKPVIPTGGSMPTVDAMGNAYRKGGMVGKPSMATAMKKYEGSPADKKADKAGAKKMMTGKPLPPFMRGKK